MRAVLWLPIGFLAGAAILSAHYLCVRAPVPSLDPTPQRQALVAPAPEARTLLPSPEPDATDAPEAEEPATSLVYNLAIVRRYTQECPNSPLRFVPLTASASELAYLEHEAQVILADWQERRDALWAAHQDNLLAFVADPTVLQNDQDRQQKLRSLVNSLWPHAMP